jgi:hypothetical protein
VDRRRAVVRAGWLSVALVLGSGLAALGAGAFAAPPVDHVGSFSSINAELEPSSTTASVGTIVPRPRTRESRPDASGPRGVTPVDAPTTSRLPAVVSPPASGLLPAADPQVRSHDSTTGRVGTTVTSEPERGEEHELPERESPELEEPDD